MSYAKIVLIITLALLALVLNLLPYQILLLGAVTCAWCVICGSAALIIAVPIYLWLDDGF